MPYAVAYVDLDEGPRFLTNVTGVEDPSSDVHIGQRVTIDWEEYEELSIPLVRPV
ncbi:OB-fold domain-containing protein [Pseudomonadales bacterium]|nr:OB-fold domain-containing protein [Pseudomonadales bacterium]